MIIFLSSYLGEPSPDTARRMAVARASWEAEWNSHPHVWRNPALTFTRDSTSIGDASGVPFIRDMLAVGVQMAQDANDPQAILFLSNADIGCAIGVTGRLIKAVSCVGGVYLRRREFVRIDDPKKTRADVKAGGQFVGGDAFAFTAEWWNEFGGTFPDMLLGRYAFDSCLKNLIRRAGGAELTNEIYHEEHPGNWLGLKPGEEHDAEYSQLWRIPGNVHNKRLLDAWIATYGGNSQEHLHPIGELGYKY